jgi:hypothetical protein
LPPAASFLRVWREALVHKPGYPRHFEGSAAHVGDFADDLCPEQFREFLWDFGHRRAP